MRQGDDQWFDIVRWTFFALIEAEERGVTQANVDEMLRSEHPKCGACSASPATLAADGARPRWAYNAIKAVGNYGEIFERNLGGQRRSRCSAG